MAWAVQAATCGHRPAPTTCPHRLAGMLVGSAFAADAPPWPAEQRLHMACALAGQPAQQRADIAMSLRRLGRFGPLDACCPLWLVATWNGAQLARCQAALQQLCRLWRAPLAHSLSADCMREALALVVTCSSADLGVLPQQVHNLMQQQRLSPVDLPNLLQDLTTVPAQQRQPVMAAVQALRQPDRGWRLGDDIMGRAGSLDRLALQQLCQWVDDLVPQGERRQAALRDQVAATLLRHRPERWQEVASHLNGLLGRWQGVCLDELCFALACASRWPLPRLPPPVAAPSTAAVAALAHRRRRR